MIRRIFPFLIAASMLLSGCSETLPPAADEPVKDPLTETADKPGAKPAKDPAKEQAKDQDANAKPPASKAPENKAQQKAPSSGQGNRSDTKTYPTDDLNIPKTQVQLVKAVDGDTITVKFQGKEEKVRFLLVDTPETNHPRLGAQPFGAEAKAFTKKIVENASLLELEFDIGPNRDKYSRLLAYVYADGVMVQEQLLKKGLARVAYIYPPNTRYVDKFNDLQRISRKQELGIWSVENYAREDGFHPQETKPAPAPSKQPQASPKPDNSVKPGSGNSGSCRIKGNINSKGDKIYHVPGSRHYEKTNPEKWFCSEQEAQKAGFRAPLR